MPRAAASSACVKPAASRAAIKLRPIPAAMTTALILRRARRARRSDARDGFKNSSRGWSIHRRRDLDGDVRRAGTRSVVVREAGIDRQSSARGGIAQAEELDGEPVHLVALTGARERLRELALEVAYQALRRLDLVL